MRLTTAAIALAAVFAVIAASAAEAQQRKRTPGDGSTVFTSRDEHGRTRTKIIVQKRSYLDGGTEVMPGDRPPANGMWLYGQRPTDGLGNNVVLNPTGPVLDPFSMPGKQNPWPWFMN